MVASLCCGPAPREMGGTRSPVPEGLDGKRYRNVGKPVFRPGSRFFLLKHCWSDASNGRPWQAQQFIIHCILTFLGVLGFIYWVTAWKVHSFPHCHMYMPSPKCKMLARWQTIMGMFSVLSSFSPYWKTVLEHFALGQLSVSSILHQRSSRLWGPVYNSEHVSLRK